VTIDEVLDYTIGSLSEDIWVDISYIFRMRYEFVSN
jgi:hypothetical protein